MWAGRSALCMAAGAASSPGKSTPSAGNSHTDHMAWEKHNNGV